MIGLGPIRSTFTVVFVECFQRAGDERIKWLGCKRSHFFISRKTVPWLAMNTVRRPQDTNHFLPGLCFRDLRGIFVTSTFRHRAWELLEGLGIRLQSNRRLWTRCGNYKGPNLFTSLDAKPTTAACNVPKGPNLHPEGPYPPPQVPKC